jgi:hypothetical protein
MAFWLQIGSALMGIFAAVLWFRSSASKAPPMTYEGVERLEGFLESASRLNRWAAGVTGLSMLLSAGAALASAMAGT